MLIGRFRFLCTCLTILIFSTPIHESKAERVKHVDLYYPENLDAKGKQVPLTPELQNVFATIERQSGLKFTIVILPWKRAQIEVARGRGIIYGLSKSIERLENFRFSAPVLTLPVWAISYGPENENIAELNDLKGKLVATSVGVTHGVEFERARKNFFVVEEDYLPFQERLKKLITKRSDVIFVPFSFQLKREEIEYRFHRILVAGFNDPELNGRRFNVSLNPIFLDSIHFASSKRNLQDVIDKIDVAIARGSKDGSLLKLLNNY
jgi:polar amino acid transport system substrate-binding protein